MAIDYNLICSAGHETTGTYRNIATFEKLRDKGLLDCVTCDAHGIHGSTVQQGLSKPNFNSGVSRDKNAPPHTQASQHFEDVGDRLFATALNIDSGNEPYRPLHGNFSNPSEVEAMHEMGWQIVEASKPKLDS